MSDFVLIYIVLRSINFVCLFVCLFDLLFSDPVNTLKSCRVRSVIISTLFLGKLPKPVLSAHTFASN